MERYRSHAKPNQKCARYKTSGRYLWFFIADAAVHAIRKAETSSRERTYCSHKA
jgi:hypothetical protein